MATDPTGREGRDARRFADLVEAIVVGQRPVGPGRDARPPRAARAAFRKVRVDAERLTWRSRSGVDGAMPLADVARVALVEVQYIVAKAPTPVALYALVIDRSGAARVRIGAEGNRTGLGASGKRDLREMWAPLGIPAARETTVLGQAKDYRRRWPEAFSFPHAHPLVTSVLAFAGWTLLVVPVLDRLLGT